MRYIKSISIILLLFIAANVLHAQTINYASYTPDQKQNIQFTTGYSYGLIFGLGYGYRSALYFPVVYHAEFSIPSGSTLFDDFKTSIGGNIIWYANDGFQVSTDLQGAFRRYENTFVEMLNFGADFSAIAGYYKPIWFAAAEIGLDKAIVTHFEHSAAMHDLYPDIQDGWYQPPTGGNIYYGLQGGISFEKTDITLTAGKIINDNFTTAPFIPYYAKVGINRRW